MGAPTTWREPAIDSRILLHGTLIRQCCVKLRLRYVYNSLPNWYPLSYHSPRFIMLLRRMLLILVLDDYHHFGRLRLLRLHHQLLWTFMSRLCCVLVYLLFLAAILLIFHLKSTHRVAAYILPIHWDCQGDLLKVDVPVLANH